MSNPASAQAPADVRDSGGGKAAPDAAPDAARLLVDFVFNLIAHLTHQFATGKIRTFSQFCAVCADFDAQLVRFLITQARKQDPSLPEVNCDDWGIVWLANGDFELVPKSQIAPCTPAENLRRMRAVVGSLHAWCMHRALHPSRRFRSRTARRIYLAIAAARACALAIARVFTPQPLIASARAPP